MAETDNNRYSGSKRVNLKILGAVPSFHQNLSRYQVSHLYIGTTVIEFKEKKKTLFAIIFTFGGF